MVRLVAVLGAAALVLLALAVAAPSPARAYWSPVVTGATCGAPQCYVWRSPQGVIVEGVKQITQTEFENLTSEVVATIDSVGGLPTTGIGTVQVEAGKTAAAALETETDAAVLAGAEDAAAAAGEVGSFSALGTVALSVGAIAIGWEIGNAIDGLLGIQGFGSIFGGSSGGHEYWQAKYAKAVGKGDRLTSTGKSPIAPADGFELLFCKYQSSCSESGGVKQAVLGGSEATFEGIPAGFVFVLEEAFTTQSGEHIELGAYFQQAPLSALKLKAGSLSSVFPGAKYYKSSGPESPFPSLAEQRSRTAERVLENPDDQAFNEWFPQHDGVSGHTALLSPGGVVPNCGGLTYAQCAAALEAEGLEPVRNTLGWENADISKAPDAVTQLEPAAGVTVKRPSKVTVTANPGSPGMPLVVPPVGVNETFAQYSGLLGSGLVPREVPLGEVNEDPQFGPDAVTGTNPAPGTRLDPSTAPHTVDVRVNPSTAPIPGAGAGTCTASVPGIDWGPLNQPIGNKFPFGVFAFFTGWLGTWETGSAEPPEWTVTILPAGVFGSPHGLQIHVNLAFMAPIVSVVRIAFLLLSFIGMLWFLSTAAAKLQGDAS